MRSIVQSTLQKCKKGQQAQQLIGPKLESDINASTNFWIAIGKPLQEPLSNVHMMRTWLLSPYTKGSKSYLGMYNFGHSLTSSLVTTASFIDVAFTKAGMQHFVTQKRAKRQSKYILWAISYFKRGTDSAYFRV